MWERILRLLDDFQIWLRQRRREPKLYPRRHFIYKLIAEHRGWREACDEDNLIFFLYVWHPDRKEVYEGPTAWKDIALGRPPKKMFTWRRTSADEPLAP